MQETHSVLSDTKMWNSEWGAKATYAHGRSNSKGVAILFKRGFNPTVSNVVKDPEGRFLIMQIVVEGESLTLINVYAPTQSEGTEQSNFLENLNSTIDDLEISDVLMGGDFNIHIHQNSGQSARGSHLGDSNPRSSSQRSRYITSIHALLDQYHLADAWLHKFPRANRSTFHRGSQNSILDYWFLPCHMLDSISNFSITPHPLSDHSILSVSIGLIPQDRGPGYWRFNNQLLEDT